jgi:hypothetical protein
MVSKITSGRVSTDIAAILVGKYIILFKFSRLRVH